MTITQNNNNNNNNSIIIITIIIINIIIQYVCLLSQAFLPGTSLEPAVIPTAQASSFTLQYVPLLLLLLLLCASLRFVFELFEPAVTKSGTELMSLKATTTSY